jgi:hypothetical protein
MNKKYNNNNIRTKKVKINKTNRKLQNHPLQKQQEKSHKPPKAYCEIIQTTALA